MNTPNIRFKGFTGDWEQRKLGYVVEEFYNGQTPYRQNKIYWDGDINWLSSGDLNRGLITNTVEKITEEGKEASGLKLVPKGTLVIAIMGLEAAGTRGNCGILAIDTTINQACMALIVDSEQISSYFLFQWYKRFGNAYALKFTQGTKQQNYNAELLADLDISYPKIEEQTKIGEYFSRLDNLITLHQRKCDDLKEVKKYMLQKMFPKKGEKVPEIRFKGFTEDWEVKKLGDFFTERSERASGDEELLSITIGSGVIRQIDSDKRNTASEDKSNYKVVKQGDVPYNSMRMWQGAVGTSDYDGIVSPAYTVLTPKENANGKFFMELFKKESTLEIFKRWSQGLTSDTWNLKFPVLSTIVFAAPRVEEQSKIATYFTALDNQITLYQKKLDTLKEVKKFMLQNMFPQ